MVEKRRNSVGMFSPAFHGLFTHFSLAFHGLFTLSHFSQFIRGTLKHVGLMRDAARRRFSQTADSIIFYCLYFYTSGYDNLAVYYQV